MIGLLSFFMMPIDKSLSERYCQKVRELYSNPSPCPSGGASQSAPSEGKKKTGELNMIRPIIHDPLFLAQRSEPASKADSAVITDLTDTLRANLDRCVGMAANMIGQRKRIIVFCSGPLQLVMVNPEIIARSGEYDTEEGCLSLAGVRKTKRWRKITVTYQDQAFHPRTGSFEGFTAQIIQHEIDHCDGVLI